MQLFGLVRMRFSFLVFNPCEIQFILFYFPLSSRLPSTQTSKQRVNLFNGSQKFTSIVFFLDLLLHCCPIELWEFLDFFILDLCFFYPERCWIFCLKIWALVLKRITIFFFDDLNIRPYFLILRIICCKMSSMQYQNLLDDSFLFNLPKPWIELIRTDHGILTIRAFWFKAF